MWLLQIGLVLKNIILLVTSCNVKSVTVFSPENIICGNYINVYVNYFWN